MPSVQRIGDSNSGGGVITGSQQSSVYANGKLVSVNGSPVSGHGTDIHASPVTANGVSSVLVGGIPINVQGNSDTCGHVRVGGSGNVNAG